MHRLTTPQVNMQVRDGLFAVLSRITQKSKTRFVYAHDDGGLAYGIEKTQFFHITGISVEVHEVGIWALWNNQYMHLVPRGDVVKCQCIFVLKDNLSRRFAA